MPRITTNLWFDTQALEAAELYVSLFPNSRIVEVSHYGEGGMMPAGTPQLVVYELDGQTFMNLNGGPMYSLTAAVSLAVVCDGQAEVDRYWDALAEGGEESRCGWLTDRFGLSWQIIPQQWAAYAQDPVTGPKAWAALMTMSKFDLAAIDAAVRAGS
jgi:predicted 3-demethylubiquinone-9 3-methyltransferase (glyoxalase superfamily)